MQLFIDCDGILADFLSHVKIQFGHINQFSTEELWKLINNYHDFWLTIPVKDGAHRFLNELKIYNPIIITGCPIDNYDVAAANKIKWIKKNFGQDIKVITCLAKHKQNHMIAEGDILIDDFKSNIKKWEKAGGKGIIFKNVDQALADFYQLIKGNDQ